MEQGAPKGKGKGLSPDSGNAHFGQFGAGQSQKGDWGGPPGNFGGGKGGWVNGMGPFVPPNHATGPVGQAPSQWRGANRRRRQKEPKAARDAACAAELADLESQVSASEAGDSGKCFAAARHHTRVAEGLQRECPEAAAVCMAKAKAYQQRGQDSLPLSHQVATLEKQYKLKVSEADRLKGQIQTLKTQLEGVAKEGMEVKRQLDLAKAKVAAAPPSAPALAVTPPSSAAFQFFLQSANLLPPEQAGFFGACLETIQRALLADSHPVASAPMDVGGTPPGESPRVDPASLSVPSGPDEEEFPAEWLERQHAEARSSAAASPNVGHPPPLAPAARGRSPPRTRRGSAPPPPVGRSRSHSLVRNRQPRSEVDAFIDDGMKYFSHLAERAGLDDV